MRSTKSLDQLTAQMDRIAAAVYGGRPNPLRIWRDDTPEGQRANRALNAYWRYVGNMSPIVNAANSRAVQVPRRVYMGLGTKG